MLREIEDKLVGILREKIREIPKENIVINKEPSKLPALAISNLGFEFENLGLVENLDEGSVELEEKFSGDGVQTSYKLKERPLKDSILVECPPGTSLAEKKDFVVNYDQGSIGFKKVPSKGKSNICVNYVSRRRAMTVKGLKMKTTYFIEVWGMTKTDSIAEKVVKALLIAEDELAEENIELRPIGGETLRGREGEKTEKIRLKYAAERELRVKKPVFPIEKIEITSKNI